MMLADDCLCRCRVASFDTSSSGVLAAAAPLRAALAYIVCRNEPTGESESETHDIRCSCASSHKTGCRTWRKSGCPKHPLTGTKTTPSCDPWWMFLFFFLFLWKVVLRTQKPWLMCSEKSVQRFGSLGPQVAVPESSPGSARTGVSGHQGGQEERSI